jgi:hypothetical protein
MARIAVSCSCQSARVIARGHRLRTRSQRIGDVQQDLLRLACAFVP